MKSFVFVFVWLLAAGCEKNKPVTNVPAEFPANPVGSKYNKVDIFTDKSVYSPGQDVTFQLNHAQLPTGSKVRYKYLNTPIGEAGITANSWIWKPPVADFKGYTVEVFSTSNNEETIHAVTGVDVSSDWKKFPRYGFLSKFPQMTDAQVSGIIDTLNRYHINGLQFYDWHKKHHNPLPMIGGVPMQSWKDIINRDIYLTTIQKYIEKARSKNMKNMFYNLIYGTWNDGEADGVQKEWYVFKDVNRTNRDFHPLPMPPFVSNIFLVDPSNTSWQQYIKEENQKVYANLAFDGFHMDQLGDRGNLFSYNGASVNLASTYKPFINAMKAGHPQKDIVMNAVNQYGQQGIAESAAGFLYSEVWAPFESYNDLSNLIKQNNTLSNGTKNTVLAAYVNYEMANNNGFFNTPSVLLTNAVIFAFGGAHLELGEHMLGKEYFPNDNLKMRPDLRASLGAYYDFLVSYQNLLRDGGSFNVVDVKSADNKMSIGAWPAGAGSVAAFGKTVGNNQVLHLINFRDSKTQSWRDNSGIQVSPQLISDAKIVIEVTGTVKNVWMASPDLLGGASMKLNFKQSGNAVSITLPGLHYWDMIVLEY